MLQHYLLIAWRHLRKNKLYSILNLSGLAIGIAVCLLILLFVGHERSFDRFHHRAADIYLVESGSQWDGKTLQAPMLNYSTAPLLHQSLPYIEKFARIYHPWPDATLTDPSDRHRSFVEKETIFADSNFFSFFNFPLISGNAAYVLKSPFTAVISREAAIKYFGNENPLGKKLRYNAGYEITVAGVAENPPSYSTIRYDIVISMASLHVMEKEKFFVTPSSHVGGGAFENYVLLNPKKGSAFAQYLRNLPKLHDTPPDTYFTATRFIDYHLNGQFVNHSNTRYMGMFIISSLLILLLALTNYVSLSTARSSTRAKEVGIRKYFGAGRGSIAWQFMIESALYATIAFALAYLICILLQQSFFNYLDIRIDRHFFFHPYMFGIYFSLYLLSIGLAGIYPSLLLSAFEPIRAIAGRLSSPGHSLTLRQCITVFQFVISVTLVLLSITIYRQVHFIRTYNTGIRQDNIVMVPFNNSVGLHYPAMKSAIGHISAVEGVATSRYVLYAGNRESILLKSNGQPEESPVPFLSVDENFISVMDLQWILRPGDSVFTRRNAIVAINPAAVTKLRLPADPRGHTVSNEYNTFTIAGLLKNFHYNSLHQPMDPVIMSIAHDTSDSWTMGGTMYIRFKPHTPVASVIPEIRKIYDEYISNYPFEFSFMHDAYLSAYKSEEKLSRLSSIFTVITLIISCLGLFGLVNFNTQRRMKEIGIRKVLGASVHQIVALLSKDLLRLVVIAIIISSPVAWWVMNEWLDNFAYRVAIGVWIFLLAGAGVILLAFLSTGIHAIKTATSNPVKSLRTE
ncbi:MAG: ABC transporter permease [Chitinophagaceae bacterium]|nr:ABC transporter permease [Chitinophagaceae bacterium]